MANLGRDERSAREPYAYVGAYIYVEFGIFAIPLAASQRRQSDTCASKGKGSIPYLPKADFEKKEYENRKTVL